MSSEAEERAELRKLIRLRLIEALKDPSAKASMVAQAIKFLAESDALEEPVEPPSPLDLLKGLPFPPTAKASDAMTGAMRSIPPKRKPLGEQH
jgi:hypothetical protein